jgi:hypothetical protein
MATNNNNKVGITVWANSPEELAESKARLSMVFGGATFGDDKVAMYDSPADLAITKGTEAYYVGPRIRPIDQASTNPANRQQYLTTVQLPADVAKSLSDGVTTSLDSARIAALFEAAGFNENPSVDGPVLRLVEGGRSQTVEIEIPAAAHG